MVLSAEQNIYKFLKVPTPNKWQRCKRSNHGRVTWAAGTPIPAWIDGDWDFFSGKKLIHGTRVTLDLAIMSEMSAMGEYVIADTISDISALSCSSQDCQSWSCLLWMLERASSPAYVLQEDRNSIWLIHSLISITLAMTSIHVSTQRVYPEGALTWFILPRIILY